jgi:hypothetical protein
VRWRLLWLTGSLWGEAERALAAGLSPGASQAPGAGTAVPARHALSSSLRRRTAAAPRQIPAHANAARRDGAARHGRVHDGRNLNPEVVAFVRHPRRPMAPVPVAVGLARSELPVGLGPVCADVGPCAYACGRSRGYNLSSARR